MNSRLFYGSSNLPNGDAYLFADTALAEKWRIKLSRQNKPMVGLVCSGSVGHKDDRYRSVDLKNLMEALPPGPDYILLQKEIRHTDQVVLESRQDIEEYSEHLTNFSETAALICNLDMVVSVDTSVAHLAGALGKKTAVMLPHLADWRWFSNRTDSPWYNSVKLCRQKGHGNWDSVFSQVRDEIKLLKY